MKPLPLIVCLGGLLLGNLSAGADPVDVAGLMPAVNAVGPKGQGHASAMDACRQLLQADASQIPSILSQLQPDSVLASNWIRPVVEAIAQRQLQAGGQLPLASLEQMLADTTLAARGRRIAYEMIVAARPADKQRLATGLLNDPSPELRRDAVAFALNAASGKTGAPAIAAYQVALNAARDQDQIDEAAGKLRELGQTVDVARHFGFIQRWRLAGPFDNKDMQGFDVVYGPERDAAATAEYEGKQGVVRWVPCETDDQYGLVDLNQVVGKLKAAVIYACAEFIAEEAREVDVRLGCINANKVWLNGRLLTATNIYHSGTYIDQYVGQGRLKPGKNLILVKVLQNEQTEDWAQRWQYQLRVCDQYGTAVLSADREKETN